MTHKEYADKVTAYAIVLEDISKELQTNYDRRLSAAACVLTEHIESQMRLMDAELEKMFTPFFDGIKQSDDIHPMFKEIIGGFVPYKASEHPELFTDGS